MKKSLLALAVLGAFAGAASAQSSVTLYGLADVGLTSKKVDNNASTKNMDSGLLNGSRWGLRGVEDLGGGMSAVFNLESGFSLDTGTGASRLFNRTSVVGLQGGFGMVNLGRSLTLYDDVRGAFVMERTAFDPTDQVQAEGGGNYVARFDNRIRYQTPAMGGFVAGLEVSGEKGTPFTQPATGAFTNYASDSGGNKSIAAKLGYAAGPLAVWLGYQRDKDAAGPHDSLTHVTLLGSYTFGIVTLSGMYTAENNSITAADDNAKEYALGAKFQITPAADVRVAYARSKVSNNSLAAKGFGLETQYKLSARTKLYAGYRSNKDDALSPVDGQVSKDRIFGLGIQHRF